MAAILEDAVTPRRIRRLVTAAATAMLLGACSSLSAHDPTGMFGSKSLAPQAGDACARERAAFADSQSFFASDLVNAALMGGLTEAATDAAHQWVTGSSPSFTSVILPAAFHGAEKGYLSAMEKRNANNPEAIARQMRNDFSQESNAIDTLHGSFERLQSCRFQQARLIKASARSGRVTSAEAREQLAMQRRLFNEELVTARQSGKNMASRDEQFEYAAQKLSHSGSAPSESGQAKRDTVVASVTLPRKRDSFVSAVSDAELRSKSDFGDDIASS